MRSSLPDIAAAPVFDAAPNPYLLLDRNFVIVGANLAYLAVTMTTRASIVRRHVFDVFPDNPHDSEPTGVRNLSVSLRRVLATGKADAMPLQKYDVRAPDGRFVERWWSPVNAPVLDERGEVTAIIHHVEDVTDLVRSKASSAALNAEASRLETALFTSNQRLAAALKNLRASEERARLTLDHVKDHAIYTTDLDGIVTSWPPGAEAGFGWAPREIVGRSFELTFTPEDQAAGVPTQELATAREKGCAHDVRWHTRKDGSRFFIDGTTRPLHDESGAQAGFILIGRDETKRREAEARERAIAERYRLAVRATNDAVWGWDLAADRIEWNEALQALFGYHLPGGVTDGGWWMAHIYADDRDRVVGSIQAVIDGAGEHWSEEYRFLKADGGCADVVDRGTVIRDGEGRAVRMVGAIHDLTELKRAEAALRQLNEALEGRVVQEVTQRLRAEEALRQSQKMEAIGQLTGGVAHDFNNLLTIIRSSADLLLRPELPEPRRRRYVEAIAETTDRAAKLTGQLLAFGRRQALKPEVFDLAARIEAVADMLRTLLGSRVELAPDLSCQPCFIEADANQLEAALVNLAANARDAMNGEGRLTIALQAVGAIPETRGHAASRGSFVALSVSDTGTGISPQDLEHIFEPFFTTKEVGKGTGLGLSQVYGFAKQSGGEVQVKSVPGQGATFTLYLPRTDKPAAAAAPAEPAASSEPAVRRVLLVEDNNAVGAFAAQLLEELGCGIVLARNAEEAIRLVEADEPFDVVFSDVVMPGKSGVELGRELRRLRPDLPVVLTSGYSHVLAAEGTHGFELLHKPYSVEALSRVLRRATRS